MQIEINIIYLKIYFEFIIATNYSRIPQYSALYDNYAIFHLKS